VDPSWDPETVTDALDVLAELPYWRLAPSRWEHVAGLVDRLAAAIEARDVREFRDATADLELSGPVRAVRIGTAEVTREPAPVRDRRNRLIHTLGDIVEQDTSDGTGGGRAPNSLR